MTEPTPPSVRLGGPEELALAIPMLLGYQPTESLVVCALQGTRSAVGLTLRFDLDALEPIDEAVEEIAHRLAFADADSAFVAVYTERRSAGGRLPHAALVDPLIDHPDIRLRDAVLVRRGRWWSYLCVDQACCPKAGRRLRSRTAELDRLRAALVLSGSTVLSDRLALAESVAVDGDLDRPAQRRRVGASLRTVEATASRVRRAELGDLVQTLAERLEDPRAAVDDHEAARVAALLTDVEARDDLLVQAVSPRRRDEVLRVLRAVVRRVPDPYDAPVATVLAWYAYGSGDGTLANIALTRALASDPYYSLARLIEASLDRQLPPHVLEEVVREAARDIGMRDTAG